jgi:hypothetical protein
MTKLNEVRPGLTSPINRLGLCPNTECNENWDGGDILEHLSTIEAFSSKTHSEILRIAEQCYGYTKEHPTRVSMATLFKLIGNTFHGYIDKAGTIVNAPDIIKCPSCGKMWDILTGIEFNSLPEAKKYYNDLRSEQLSKDTQEQAASGVHGE